MTRFACIKLIKFYELASTDWFIIMVAKTNIQVQSEMYHEECTLHGIYKFNIASLALITESVFLLVCIGL